MIAVMAVVDTIHCNEVFEFIGMAVAEITISALYRMLFTVAVPPKPKLTMLDALADLEKAISASITYTVFDARVTPTPNTLLVPDPVG